MTFDTMCQIATPEAAWSQEVLHNAAQDLVKGFLCVFTNSRAAAAGASGGGGGHRGHRRSLLSVGSLNGL